MPPGAAAAVRRAALLGLASCHGGVEASAPRLGRPALALPALSNEDFEVKLGNRNNVQYAGEFTVGGQTLPVVYDTGSFEVLMLSSHCDLTCGQGHRLYDEAKSNTYVAETDIKAYHYFGSGPTESVHGLEKLSIGGPNSPYVKEKAPFFQIWRHGIAPWRNSDFFSGIVGMAHPDQVPLDMLATTTDKDHQLTPDKLLLTSLGINTFAMCLKRHDPDAPGMLAFGPSVASRAKDPAFSTLSVVGKLHWGVKLTGVEASGISQPGLCQPSCGVIVDSGTSLIAVPPSAAGLITALDKMIARDCSNLASLPVLRFDFEGTAVELPPQAYVMQMMTAPSGAVTWDFLFDKASASTPQGQCFSAFMTIDKKSQFGDVWILGMPFMRYHYTIFDRAAKKIHFARAGPSCEVLPKPATFASARSNVSSSAWSALGEAMPPLKVDIAGMLRPRWADPILGRKLRM